MDDTNVAAVEAEAPAQGEAIPATPAEDLAAKAAEFDAANVAAEPAPTEPGANAEVDDPIQEFINKRYGGNKQAFVTGLYEQSNSTARMHDDLQTLREELKALKEAGGKAGDPVQEAIASAPEIQQLDADIASIRSQNQDLLKQQGALSIEIGRAERAVAKAEGKLEAADELTRAECRQELMDAQRERDSKVDQYNNNARQGTENNRDLKRLERERKAAEREVQFELQRQQQSRIDEAEEKVEILSTYDQAISDLAAPLGLKPGDPTYDYLHQTIKDQMSVRARNVRNGHLPGSGLDIEAVAKELFDKAVGAMKLTQSKAFTRASQAKQASTRVAPGTRLPASTSLPTETKNADWWRARRKALVGF